MGKPHCSNFRITFQNIMVCHCVVLCVMYLQEATLEANQERMDFQRARITEVNQYLKMVMESSDRV